MNNNYIVVLTLLVPLVSNEEQQKLLRRILYNKYDWTTVVPDSEIDDLYAYVQSAEFATEEEWQKIRHNVEEQIKDFDKRLFSPDKVKTKKLTDKEINALKRRSELIERFETPKHRFIKLFGQQSVCNELMAEMYYHVLLGLLVKLNGSQIVTLSSKPFWPITHFFCIQSSATGKDQGIDFFQSIVEQYNEIAATAKVPMIRVGEISGAETQEALLDRFPKDRKGQFILQNISTDPETGETIVEDSEPVPGIFSSNDLILARECSFLFRSKSDGDRQSKAEIFLQILEGRTVQKTLDSWRTNDRQFVTYTNFNGAFVGVSRPISNMKAHLAYSGLQQRGLNLCRKIGPEERQRMHDELVKLRKRTNEDKETFRNEQRELAKSFVEIALFIRENGMPEIEQSERDEIADVVGKNIGDLQVEIAQDFDLPEHQEILLSFVGRFNHHIDVLAIHNSIGRRSKTISAEDYQNALTLLKKSYGYLRDWVEENIGEDMTLAQKRKARKQFVVQTLRRYKQIEISQLVKTACQELGVSVASAYRIIEQFTKNGLLKVDEVKLVEGNSVKMISLVQESMQAKVAQR